MSTEASSRKWTVKDIRDLVERKFSKRPCWFQIKIALALQAGKDVTGVAATGAGKTLSFWIPLLMALEQGQDKMVIVVTPLNLLGKQTEKQSVNAGLSCIAVNKDNNEATTYKDILLGKYHVISISPELLNDRLCRNVIEDPVVASKLLYIVFDEGHCISQWGHTFRNEYLHVGNLRYLLPNQVPFYVASATLPPEILHDVTDILRLRPDKTEHVFCSNDRPNIHIVVRGMAHPINSYHDLAFLIPDNFLPGSPRFRKFLVFFDSTTRAEEAIRYLRSRLPLELQDKIKWFHSTMTSAYREDEFARFASDEVWGMAVTDAFGMGLDLPDVEIVVQYRVPGDLCTLWQRFGRAGRAPGSEAIAVLLVEKNHFDEDRKKRKLASEARRVARHKRKAKAQGNHPVKRVALSTATNMLAGHTNVGEVSDGEGSASDGSASESGPFPATTDACIFNKRSDEIKRASYNRRHAQLNVLDPKQRTLELGSALDDFINAPTRGIICRRVVSNMYFGNDLKVSTDFHLLCDDTTVQGCSRCSPKTTRLCCELCSPDSFSDIAPIIIKKVGRALHKAHIKPYEITEIDRKLKIELEAWRDTHAPAAVGQAAFEEWGPSMFMSDNTIQRLVDCSHGRKLPNIEALHRETLWREDYLAKYGANLFAIIERLTPPPTTGTGSRPPRLCSVCRTPGHTKASSLCPMKIAALSATSFRRPSDSENRPPIQPTTPRATTHFHQDLPVAYFSQMTPSPNRFSQYHTTFNHATPEQRQLLPRPNSLSESYYGPNTPSSSQLDMPPRY